MENMEKIENIENWENKNKHGKPKKKRENIENMENIKNMEKIENKCICKVWWAICPQTFVYVTFREPLIFKHMYLLGLVSNPTKPLYIYIYI